jgi:hypothetical protein
VDRGGWFRDQRIHKAAGTSNDTELEQLEKPCDTCRGSLVIHVVYCSGSTRPLLPPRLGARLSYAQRGGPADAHAALVHVRRRVADLFKPASSFSQAPSRPRRGDSDRPGGPRGSQGAGRRATRLGHAPWSASLPPEGHAPFIRAAWRFDPFGALIHAPE